MTPCDILPTIRQEKSDLVEYIHHIGIVILQMAHMNHSQPHDQCVTLRRQPSPIWLKTTRNSYATRHTRTASQEVHSFI